MAGTHSLQSYRYDDQGHLSLSRLRIADIANVLPTPFYLYDLDNIRARAQHFRQCLASINPRICYAIKANSNLSVIKTLADLGYGADIVSGGELQRALAAGVSVHNIIFAGVGKTEPEIHAALRANIRQFNVESLQEINMLAQCAVQHGVSVPVALRINPDVDAGTHAKITTGTVENKFGIHPSQALALIRRRKDWPHINIKALAVHIGSQINSVTPYVTAIQRVAELVKAVRNEGLDIREVDLGGGGVGPGSSPGQCRARGDVGIDRQVFTKFIVVYCFWINIGNIRNPWTPAKTLSSPARVRHRPNLPVVTI